MPWKFYIILCERIEHFTSLNASVSHVDPSVPAWRAAIEQRKKSKEYIPDKKPQQPIKLGEIPQWKRDLAERKKQRPDGASEVPIPNLSI